MLRVSGNSIKLAIILFIIVFCSACQKDHDDKGDESSVEMSVLNKLRTAETFEDLFEKVDETQLESAKDSFIGTIKQIVKSGDRFVVLDSRVSKNVLFFTETGQFVRQVGRKGQGPGEYVQPAWVSVDEAGNVVVLDEGQNKLVFYNREGEYLKQIPLHLGGVFPLRFFIDSRDLLYCYTIHPNFTQATKSKKITVLDQSGRIRYRFGPWEPTLQKLYYAGGVMKLAPDGKIWLGNIFDLELKIYTNDGKLVKAVTEHISHISNPIRPEVFASADAKDPRAQIKQLSSHAVIRNLFFIGESLAMLMIGSKASGYLTFFDVKGNFLKNIVINPLNVKSLKGAILESHRDLLFSIEEPTDFLLGNKALDNIPNPKIVVFRFRS